MESHHKIRSLNTFTTHKSHWYIFSLKDLHVHPTLGRAAKQKNKQTKSNKETKKTNNNNNNKHFFNRTPRPLILHSSSRTTCFDNGVDEFAAEIGCDKNAATSRCCVLLFGVKAARSGGMEKEMTPTPTRIPRYQRLLFLVDTPNHSCRLVSMFLWLLSLRFLAHWCWLVLSQFGSPQWNFEKADQPLGGLDLNISDLVAFTPDNPPTHITTHRFSINKKLHRQKHEATLNLTTHIYFPLAYNAYAVWKINPSAISCSLSSTSPVAGLFSKSWRWMQHGNMDPSDTRQPAIPKYFPIFFHLKMESFVPNTKVRFKECVRTYYLKHWCKPNKNMVTIDSSYVSKFLAMRNTSKSSSKGCQAQIVNGMWMGTYHCVERLSWSKFITSRLFRTMCYPIHSIALRFVIYEDTRYVTYCNMKITIEQK